MSTLEIFENPKLFVIGSICLVILIICGVIYSKYKSKSINSRSELINQIYGTDSLLKSLGWKAVSFPIVGFEGVYSEPAQVISLEEYISDYFYGSSLLLSNQIGFGANYLVDSKGDKYMIGKTQLSTLGISNPILSNLEFENVIKTNENIEYNKLRNIILKGIAESNKDKWGKDSGLSVYSGLEKEIENSSNMQELTTIMARGNY